MHYDAIEPGIASDISTISPKGGSFGKKSTERLIGTTMSDVYRMQSLVNDLLSRVAALEKEIALLKTSNDEVSTVVNNISTEVGTHYHSSLVFPGTETVAFQIDADGGVVMPFGWKWALTDAYLKAQQNNVDKGLEL